MLFALSRRTKWQISKVSISLVLASCSRNPHVDTSKGRIQQPIIKHQSSLGSNIVSTASSYVAFKTNSDCRNPKLLIYKLSTLFTLTLICSLVCNHSNLTSLPGGREKRDLQGQLPPSRPTVDDGSQCMPSTGRIPS